MIIQVAEDKLHSKFSWRTNCYPAPLPIPVVPSDIVLIVVLCFLEYDVRSFCIQGRQMTWAIFSLHGVSSPKPLWETLLFPQRISPLFLFHFNLVTTLIRLVKYVHFLYRWMLLLFFLSSRHKFMSLPRPSLLNKMPCPFFLYFRERCLMVEFIF